MKTRSFYLQWAALPLVALFWGLLSPASASETASYTLAVSGKHLGDLTVTTVSRPDGSRSLSQRMSLKASSFWGKLDIDNRLEETISSNGILLKASNRLRDNNKVYWTRIDLLEEEYLAFRAQMKNGEEKDLEELGNLAKGAVSVLVPGAGDVLEIANVVLAYEKSQPRHDRFTRTSFDTSLMGLPLFWQRNGQGFPARLTILDTQEMSISTVRVEKLGPARLTISGNKEFQTQRYRLKPKSGHATDVSLFISQSGTPQFAMVSGKQDGDSYTIKLVEID